MKDEAAAIHTTFERLFSLFARCHDTYSKSKPISDAKIDEFSKYKVNSNHCSLTAMQLTFAINVLPPHAGTQVDTFLEFYRTSFPDASITPKMHMLEDHMVPWMRHWHWSLGFHGEQGAESIHNIFNSLERTYSAI